MFKRSTATAVVLSLALVASLATAAPASPRNFAAPLSGDQEVPSVDTRARGLAKFQLSLDGTELSFRLNVANIVDVTQAHIHLEERGENGPVVVWLYPSGPPAQLIPGRTDGQLSSGVITEADFVGQLAGDTMAELIGHIQSGNAYVNVHTTANPGGEIRGQIDVPRGRAG